MSAEMIIKLFEAQSTMFAVSGKSNGLSREAYIAAAANASRLHPAGWQMLLASHSVDSSSLDWLLSHLTTKLGKAEIASMALLIALGRPLPAQMDTLIAKSPYYDSERRRAAIVMEKAKRAHRAGHKHEYQRLMDERNQILTLARDQVADQILQTGRCPKCHGSGKRERKGDDCPVCQGVGKVIPAITLVSRLFGAEAKAAVEREVDFLLAEMGEFSRALHKQEQKEREAG